MRWQARVVLLFDLPTRRSLCVAPPRGAASWRTSPQVIRHPPRWRQLPRFSAPDGQVTDPGGAAPLSWMFSGQGVRNSLQLLVVASYAMLVGPRLGGPVRGQLACTPATP